MPPPYNGAQSIHSSRNNDDHQYTNPENHALMVQSHEESRGGIFCGCGGSSDVDKNQFKAYNKPISKNASVHTDRNIQISPHERESPGCSIGMSMDNNTIHCPFEDFCKLLTCKLLM